MKEINVADITAEVRRLCIEAACDLPRDVEKLICQATETEESEFGTYAMEKICRNIKIARENNVPMCQDTGMVIVFVEIGQEVHIAGGLLDDAINAGVAAGYIDGYLRKSTVIDPVLNRKNAGDNTPAIIYTSLVAGDELRITVMPKGAGSENMSQLKMLKPADGLEGVKRFIVDRRRWWAWASAATPIRPCSCRRWRCAARPARPTPTPSTPPSSASCSRRSTSPASARRASVAATPRWPCRSRRIPRISPPCRLP